MLSLSVAPVETVPGVDVEPTGELPGWLGDDERRRVASLAGPARQAFLASRALTRQLLAGATGVDAARWRLSAPAGRGAEASLAEDDDGPAPAQALPRVSLAHRLGWVVAAVADGDVGVDIECERPVRSAAVERASLMLTADEIAYWRRLPEAEREPALLCAWVAKEAWYKALPPGTAPWDFRRVAARPARPEEANVRVWSARPLWVAVCRDDAPALMAVRCEGLPEGATVDESWWRVHRIQ